MKRIAFITPYPEGKAGSQRFRFEQYLDLLREEGFRYDFYPFLSPSSWEFIYQRGHLLRKILTIAGGLLSRLMLLFRLGKYDVVFIHREAAPFGPPFFEFIICRLMKKNVIYDFDDAIWLPNTSESNSLAAGIKWHSKIASICSWVDVVSVGNDYLADFARQYNSNVKVIPTTIDTEKVHRFEVEHQPGKFVIGWTGTHSTAKYLEEFQPVLSKLQEELDFELRVISDQKPELNLKKWTFIKWSPETEVNGLLEFSAGIMPMPSNPWTKGKCGFKALQYMACGVPAVVSPVGVNKQIVCDESVGFVCSNEEEWIKSLNLLADNVELRNRIGRESRKRVVDHYSRKANRQKFLSLFDTIP